jgi:hypothetical protein
MERQAEIIVKRWRQQQPRASLTSAAIATATGTPEAAGDDVGGIMVRASDASARSTTSASSSGTRKRNHEDAFAAAAALGERAGNDIEESAPLEVRMFLPELGEIALSVDGITKVLDRFGEALVSLPDTFHACSPEQLRSPQFLADAGFMGDPDDIRKSLRAVHDLVGDVHTALTRLRDARRRAWDMYMLATQTDGASWLTVKQLKYREWWDRSRLRMNPEHKSIEAWSDKVAEALRRCRQESALSKDGELVGPVDPFVTQQLRSAARRGAAAGGQGHRSKSARATLAPAAKGRNRAGRDGKKGRGGGRGAAAAAAAAPAADEA